MSMGGPGGPGVLLLINIYGAMYPLSWEASLREASPALSLSLFSVSLGNGKIGSPLIG